MTNDKQTDVPFFARFLEGQEYPEVRTDVKAGIHTMKAPSDGDEYHTMKYPSDGDDYSSS